MSTNSKHSLNNAFNGDKQGQDTYFCGQMKRVYTAFSEKPKTMKQAEQETGVMRANICRYVGKWKKADKIGVSYLGVCPITKHNKVQFLTADPDLFLIPKDMK